MEPIMIFVMTVLYTTQMYILFITEVFTGVLFCFNRLGPMVRSWCMRYESKHTYFKQVAISLGNFINVPFTVAERHQKLQSLNFFNEGDKECSTVMKPLECGPGI